MIGILTLYLFDNLKDKNNIVGDVFFVGLFLFLFSVSIYMIAKYIQGIKIMNKMTKE